MMLQRLRDVVRESPTAERFYARAMTVRARFRRTQVGRVDTLLRGIRPVGARAAHVSSRRMLHDALQRNCFDNGVLRPASANALLQQFQKSEYADAVRAEFRSYSIDNQVRIRFPRSDDDSNREGDLVVLKPHDPVTGEKGVLLVSYTESIRRFASLFDVAALASRYAFVLEPSWWGYEDLGFLLLIGSDADVIVQASSQRDFDFIRSLEVNLYPVRLGAGQWMDSTQFKPQPDKERTFDLVMVSMWSPFKRHAILFEMLASLKKRGRTLRVALIGYPEDWEMSNIIGLMRHYDVEDCCTMFENIPSAQVAEIVGSSGAYVLLSRREGSNRALYEAMFCDTPVIVHRHHRGVNTEHVNDMTGVLFDDGELERAVVTLLDTPGGFKPREWALANAGYQNCTAIIDAALQASADAGGLPYTRALTPKYNFPNPSYITEAERRAYDSEYEQLKAYLL